MSEPTIERLYEQVRAAMPAAAPFAPATLEVVSPRIRVLALRTPTLPPAAHTNVYLVGPADGPVVLLIGEATAVRHAAQVLPVTPAELVVSSRA